MCVVRVVALLLSLSLSAAQLQRGDTFIALQEGNDYITTSVLDPLTGFAFFATATFPPRLLKISQTDLRDKMSTAAVETLELEEGDGPLNCVAFSAKNGLAYFGTATAPARIVGVDLRSFKRVGAAELEAVDGTLAVGMTDERFAYFGTEAKPSKLLRIDLSTFSFAQPTYKRITVDEDKIKTGLLVKNGYAFLATDSVPAKVIKVSLRDWVIADNITLPEKIKNIQCATMEETGTFGYFGTGGSPSSVVKVQLQPNLAFQTSLKLKTGEGPLVTAAMDSENGELLFGAGSSPGKVIKLVVGDDLAEAEAITLEDGDDPISTMILDPVKRMAIFASASKPAHIIKAFMGAQVSTPASTNFSPPVPAKTASINITRPANLTEPAGNKCPSKCSGHGECREKGCTCFRGWSGKDCSQLVSSCPKDCSGHGTCIGNVNLCKCFAHWNGDDCATPLCPGNCSNRGVCLAGSCACQPGYTGPDCSLVTQTCKNNCTGHGDCESGDCVCHNRYEGEDCSVEIPTCPANCSGHGECVQGSCLCKEGYTHADCSVPIVTCPKNCSGHGICNADGSCTCLNGYHGVSCYTPAGDLALVGSIMLKPGEKEVSVGVMDPVAGVLYLATRTSPSKLISVGTKTLSRQDAIDMSKAPVAAAASGGRKAADKRAKTLSVEKGVSGQVSLLEMASAAGISPGAVVSAAFDPLHRVAYLGTELTSVAGNFEAPQVVKLDLTSMKVLGSMLVQGAQSVSTAVMDASGGFVYMATSARDSEAGTSSFVMKIKLEDFMVVDKLEIPDTTIKYGFIDKPRGHLYLGSASKLRCISLQDFVLKNEALELVPKESAIAVTCAVADPTNGFAYMGTTKYPGLVFKVQLGADLKLVSTLSLSKGENNILAAAIDVDEHWAYFTTFSSHVVRVNLHDFTKDKVLYVASEATGPLSTAVMNPQTGYLYAASSSAPSVVLKLRTFAVSGCAHNCSNNGVCTNGVCGCFSLYSGSDCSIFNPVSCLNDCSGNGKCVKGNCSCRVGWSGEDCSMCSRNCSNHGECINGNCECDPGYAGDDCEIPPQEPVPTTRPRDKDALPTPESTGTPPPTPTPVPPGKTKAPEPEATPKVSVVKATPKAQKEVKVEKKEAKVEEPRPPLKKQKPSGTMSPLTYTILVMLGAVAGGIAGGFVYKVTTKRSLQGYEKLPGY